MSSFFSVFVSIMLRCMCAPCFGPHLPSTSAEAVFNDYK